MKINRNKNRSGLYAFLIIAGFFVIVFMISLSQFVWIDEGFTLTTIAANVRSVWHRAFIFEGQPPLFFVILAVWRNINSSVFFIRIFSVLSVTFALFFSYLIIKKNIKSVNPLIVLAFFAFLPFVVWTALEIRVYAMVLFLSVVAIWLFLEIYAGSGMDIPYYKRLIYSLVALISVYTQYYLVLLFVGNFVFLLINKKWKSSKYYLIDMIIPVLCSLYLLKYLPSQMSIHSYTTLTPVTINEIISINTHKISSYLFPYINSYSTIYRYAFVLTVVIIITVFSGKKILTLFQKSNYFIFITIFLTIAFSGLLFVTDRLNLLQRHTISMIFPLTMTFLLLIGEIKSNRIKYLLIGLLLAINTGSIVNRYVLGHPKGKEYVQVCEFIEKNDKFNEPVFCYRNDISLMIKHYGLSNEIVQIPVDIDFNARYDRWKWVIRDTDQLDSLFSTKDVSNGFWLIMSEADPANPAHYTRYGIIYKYDLLKKYVSENFNVVLENTFEPGFVLREVKPKANKKEEQISAP